MEGSPIARDSGRRRKTIGKIIKWDLEVKGLSINMIYSTTLWPCFM